MGILWEIVIFYYQKCGDSMGISYEYTLWLITIPMEATAHIYRWFMMINLAIKLWFSQLG